MHSCSCHASREYQSSKRAILREVGESLYQIFEELEETRLRTARAALFGSEFFDFYRVVRNRQVFFGKPERCGGQPGTLRDARPIRARPGL